jgi:hypothetical protein
MTALRMIVLLTALIGATIAITAVTTAETTVNKPEPSFTVNFLSTKAKP